jgi:hypothetical protein
VTDFYTIDAAEARLPEAQAILEALRDQRKTLIELRDKTVERIGELESATTGQGGTASGSSTGKAEAPASVEADPGIRSLRLRMQGVIDQMQAGVARLDEWSITLRDIESGLIDFPALANGRPIWLCWRLGEDRIEWWHEHDEGFGSRRPLLDLE